MSEAGKEVLLKAFKKIADELIKARADSVAIWVKWEGGVPIKVDYELNVGVCECGEWAVYCEGCYDAAYDRGKRDGRAEAER